MLMMAASVLLLTPSVAANVDNFHISDFAAEYVLDRDDEGRSTLEVTETITAEFPDFDQNKGLVREIPVVYDGHPVAFSLESLKRNGATERIYSNRRQAKMQVVATGTEQYLRGQQVYEFRYKLRDVTRYFDDNNRDEFYWDINGTGWRVPLSRVSVTLRLGPGLAERLTGDKACYQGSYGSVERCDITRDEEALMATTTDLGRRQNMTIAVGFQPETFAAYQPTLAESIIEWWQRSLLVTLPAGLILIVWLFVMRHRWQQRSSELGTIVPEYLPPKDTSVTVAADIFGWSSNIMVAQLVDLAVRRAIRIYETKPKSLWQPAEYEIEITEDISTLRPEERGLLVDLFYAEPSRRRRALEMAGQRPTIFSRLDPDKMDKLPLAIGEKLALKTLRNNMAVSSHLQNNDKQLKYLVRDTYGLRVQDVARQSWLKRAGWLLLVPAVLLMAPTLLLASITAFVIAATLRSLSDSGLVLRRYLLGLRDYIKVAEAERLQMLQSPEGAQKIGSIDPNDPAQLVKLYERNLPYAVLFGQEKEWNKALAHIYQAAQQQPDWYVGQTAFNAAAFSGMMNNFSSAVGSTAASSSSSGGSGGGGFSGGGGGGGGGGGR